MSCLKHQKSWHICTKHSDISEKVTASYTACHNQISHAQTLNFSKKTFSTCAWLRYNLPFFPFKTNYMQSDLKRWLMSRWQSFLLPMNIPFEYLCYLIYNDTPPYPTDERQEWKKQRSANIFLIYVQLCVVVWISWK